MDEMMTHKIPNHFLIYSLVFIFGVGCIACSINQGKKNPQVEESTIAPKIISTSTIVPTSTAINIPTPSITPLPIVMGNLKSMVIKVLCLNISEVYKVSGEPFQQDLFVDVSQLLNAAGMQA